MARGDDKWSDMTIRERMALGIVESICQNEEYDVMSYETCAKRACKQTDALLAELAKD